MISHLFLFLSEQACVICGTKGQEGQVINFGHRQQSRNIHIIQNKLASISNFEHMLEAAEKNIDPECLRITMLPQDVILQRKDIHPQDSRTVFFILSRVTY